jgi:hypothetical protein
MMAWSAGYVAGVFLGELLFFALNPNGSLDYKLNNIVQFCTIFILIAMAIGTCTFLSDFNKKTKREAFLMLPASNLEKYLSAVLYILSFFAVCVLISFALGDTLRMVFRNLVYGDEWKSAIPMLINNMILNLWCHPYATELMWFDIMLVIVFVATILWIHSTYTLGGTLLRKYSFVITSVFLIVCFILFVKFMTYFQLTMFHTQWKWENGTPTLESYELGIMSYVVAVALIVFSCFNYRASFHIFKGFQLITNKWFNYDILKR